MAISLPPQFWLSADTPQYVFLKVNTFFLKELIFTVNVKNVSLLPLNEVQIS
jgi:hypothetical protein